jgi:hypothetical protein
MLSKTLIRKLGLALGLLLTFFFQNCSQFLSTDAQGSRADLMQHKIFLATQTVDEDAVGEILALGGGNNNGGGGAAGTSTSAEDCLAQGECEHGEDILTLRGPRQMIQPIRYYCSNDWTSKVGQNTLGAAALKVAFVKADNTIACEVSGASLKDGVVNQKKLIGEVPVNTCPNLVNGRYTMLVIPATDTFNTDTNVLITRRTMIIGNNDHDHPQPYMVDVTLDTRGYVGLAPVNGKEPFLLYKPNKGGALNDQCEEVNSPLVVQLTTRPQKIRLTSPLLGVLFDILGLNDTPAHSQHRISWFSVGDSASHYFIALPDSSGRVLGIDQLFGNNTQGPDGRFAPNGYEALRKFDKDGDGLITERDPVFQQLRLWSDRNLNGVAETIELYRLDEKGLKSIDLHYDAHFGETDRWGNQIKMKSVVENRQGELFLMYDIWFRQID